MHLCHGALKLGLIYIVCNKLFKLRFNLHVCKTLNAKLNMHLKRDTIVLMMETALGKRVYPVIRLTEKVSCSLNNMSTYKVILHYFCYFILYRKLLRKIEILSQIGISHKCKRNT